jgi:hypothetical protein
LAGPFLLVPSFFFSANNNIYKTIDSTPPPLKLQRIPKRSDVPPALLLFVWSVEVSFGISTRPGNEAMPHTGHGQPPRWESLLSNTWAQQGAWK